MSVSSSAVASRIDQIAIRFGGAQNKRGRVLSMLEKHDICKKRFETKVNKSIKLEEFTRLFPGICSQDPVV